MRIKQENVGVLTNMGKCHVLSDVGGHFRVTKMTFRVIHVEKEVFSEKLGRNWNFVDCEKDIIKKKKKTLLWAELWCPPNSYVEVLTPSTGILTRRED